MSRPRIAVAGATRVHDGQTRTGVNAAYVHAVLAAGGLPVVFPPELSREETIELFNDCDALLLTGGEDIDPSNYHATPHPALGAVDCRRDINEFAMVAEARARELPILAICRGMQLCNVAFGGTLIQDLPSLRPDALDHDPGGERNGRSHRVTMTAGSRVADLLGVTQLDTNSFHHQAVDTIGTGLVASGSTSDGVVEALESSDPRSWIVAVQWHPEELALEPEAADLKLFSAFVTAARRG